MVKNKNKRYINGGLDSHFWEDLKRKTIIDSTASSLRLSGVNITNKKVRKIIKAFTPKSAKHKN